MKKEIDQRKRTEATLRLYEETIENMAEGVYLIRTSDGVIVYTNPQLERMFGYGSGELKGKHVSIVNAPTEKSPEETAEEIIQSLKEKGVSNGLVAVFIGCRGIKPIYIPIMVSFFGISYVLILTFFTLVGMLAGGYLVGVLVKE